MTEEIVQLIDDFKVVLQEEAAGFPCRGKFKKIGEELRSFESVISGRTLPEQTINEARDSLHDLHGILKECREHKNEACAGNFKAVSVLPRLRKLTKRLETIRGAAALAAAHDAGAVGGEGMEPYIPVEIREYEFTSSFIEREKIHGMEAQVKEIVDRLVKTTSFDAVGIVGMQGSGKTALAQKVFTDDRVMDKFALRLWVCVSPHHCKPEEVLMRMLDSLGLDLDEVQGVVKKSGMENVGVLLFFLYMVLLDNSYLIVFDDVRSGNEDDDAWYRNLARSAPDDREWTQRLAYGLPKGDLGGGSAVIVTSRSEDVARAMVGSGGAVHRMQPLQDELLEDGWAVFETAFHDEAPELKMDPQSEWMKKLIVEKCNGLPLALRVAGRGLALRKNDKEEARRNNEEATLVQPDATPRPLAEAPPAQPGAGTAPLQAPPGHPGASPLISPDAALTTTTPLPSEEAPLVQPGATPAPPKASCVQPEASSPISPDASPVTSPKKAPTQADIATLSDDEAPLVQPSASPAPPKAPPVQLDASPPSSSDAGSATTQGMTPVHADASTPPTESLPAKPPSAK